MNDFAPPKEETQTIAELDLNLATLDEIDSLPGIGYALAGRILEARPFSSVEDLTRVQGISAVMLERMRNLVTVSIPVIGPAVSEAEPEVEESQPVQPGTPDESVPVIAEFEQAWSEVSEETIEDESAGIPESIESTSPADDLAPEPPPAPTKAPAPATTPAQTQGYAGGDLLWVAMGSSLVTLILAVLLTLGLLAAINGGLRYTRPAELAALESQLGGVQLQAEAMRGDLEGLRGRLDNLEGLSGRVTSVEQVTVGLQEQVQAARSDVDALSEDVTLLGDQLSAMQVAIDSIEAATSRFTTFLQGLADLLNGLPLGQPDGK